MYGAAKRLGAKEAVKIKGARSGLLIFVDPAFGAEELKRSLEEKLARAKDFFRGASFSLLSSKGELLPGLKGELEEICLRYGLSLREVPALFPAPSREEEGEGATFLFSRSLRAGQSFVAPGNAVVLGNVHPGAEVKAKGSIFVVGSLCGSAWAGAEGDERAFVLAYAFFPRQLKIASYVFDVERNGEKGPCVALLKGGRIVTLPYKPGLTPAPPAP